MSRHHLFLFAAVVLALLGYMGFEVRIARRQEEELAALRQRAAKIEGEAAALRLEQNTVARDLAEAERQLAALPSSSADPKDSPERRSQLDTWLGRVRQLHRLFDTEPGQRIPEMQFL